MTGLSRAVGACLAALVLVCCSKIVAGESVPAEPPLPPRLPSQFRAKLRFWLANHDEPTLVLYHHDGLNRRSREDYYGLTEERHQRIYTAIRLLERGTNHMIFHKQERSPRACFITPATQFVLDFDKLRSATFVGRASLERPHVALSDQPDGAGPGEKAAASVECNHFYVRYDAETEVEFCVGDDGKPIVFESPLFRADVLAFEPGEQLPALFDPDRASKAKCGVIGTREEDTPQAAANESGEDDHGGRTKKGGRRRRHRRRHGRGHHRRHRHHTDGAGYNKLRRPIV